jgi:mono/diheme cytochrome c family protein
MKEKIAWFAGYCLSPLLLLIGSVLVLSSCGLQKRRAPQFEVWDDMRRQEKFKPQQLTALFPDGHTSRRPPVGTVARGYLKVDEVYKTGLISPDTFVGKNPVPIDADLLKLGQKRYNVYCTPCHDGAATGHGTVAAKAPTFQPANLHDDRIKKASDGEIFYAITNGKRNMPPYKFQVADEHDRWAIVAYVRVLQRMSSGAIEDVPEAMRMSLGLSKSETLLPPPPPPPVPAAPPQGGNAQ